VRRLGVAFFALALLLLAGCATLLVSAGPPAHAPARGTPLAAVAATPPAPNTPEQALPTGFPGGYTVRRSGPPLPAEDATPALPAPTPPAPTPTVTPIAFPPGHRAAGTVPVLMYHYVRVNPDPSDRLGFGLSVTPQDFEAQMAFLAQRGYHTLLPGDLDGPAAATGKAIVITFDDGYADAYDVAYPILRRYGFKGTFYVITGFVGWPRYMTWEQITALAADGNAIGSHTVKHPDLRKLGEVALRRELADSRAELERHVGGPVLDFCYPSGAFNAWVESLVGQAGYKTAVTTAGGYYAPGVDSLAIPRVRISGGMSLAAFAAAIGESAP